MMIIGLSVINNLYGFTVNVDLCSELHGLKVPGHVIIDAAFIVR